MFGSFAPPPISDIEYWRYESVAPGSSLKGWKAGHPIGIPAHHAHKTRPCLDAFTLGELPCELPHAEFKLGFHAYMPIITDDGEKLVVGVRRNQFARACEIAVGEQIIVSRGNHKTKPVIVVLKKWSEWKVCAAVDPLDPKDISAWLLRLWNIPALTSWVKLNPEKAKGGELDTSKLVKVKVKAEPSKEPSPADLEVSRDVLRAGLAGWSGNENGQRSTQAPAGDRKPSNGKALDVLDLGVRNPLRNRIIKGGAK